MRYMGSKNNHAKHIIPLMVADRKEGQYFVDLFAGGMNLIDKVKGNHIANDINPYVVELFRAVQVGWIPPTELSEELYNDIKNNKADYPPHLVGFVGFGCSFGGKWFGGYARPTTDKKGKVTYYPEQSSRSVMKQSGRNHTDESSRNVRKQSLGMEGVKLFSLDYRKVFIPDNSIIYLDPPYANTTKYKGTVTFNHGEMFAWARGRVKEGHAVFVSEYNAPDDFQVIWEKEVKVTVSKDTEYKTATEKLFTLK